MITPNQDDGDDYTEEIIEEEDEPKLETQSVAADNYIDSEIEESDTQTEQSTDAEHNQSDEQVGAVDLPTVYDERTSQADEEPPEPEQPIEEEPAVQDPQEGQPMYGHMRLRSNRNAPGRFANEPRKPRIHAAVRKERFQSVDDREESEQKRMFAMKLTIRQGIKKLGYAAITSVVKEIMQLVDMDTFEGVEVSKLSEKERKLIIPSSTFLKDKYTAEGEFLKLKARLVAGGHMQDRTVYDNGASPTASTTSIFMIAGVAASEHRAVASIDFPGAFLNSKMLDDGKPVYMRLNKFETKVLTAIDRRFEKFVQHNGTCVVKLKRALYGCVESARMWYEKLAGELEGMGYIRNKCDMCVFNRIEKDKTQSTLVIHVDDVMITANNEETIDAIISEIQEIYKGLEIQRGRKIEYLGMVFDFEETGKCKVTMNGYITNLLEFCGEIIGEARTPATANLFKVDKKSEKLGKAAKEFFHSATAKLLYLGKRVRPDILTAVSFLVKRVQDPTKEYEEKLKRLIRYVRKTKDMGIGLEGTKNLSVAAYVDASYGVHEDMKSHTGVVIGIGKGPIYSKSSTQKLNTKSSTEAELVGLSDSTNQIIWVRNFLEEQGYHLPPAKVYQDNMSTIALIKNGKSGSDKTRHIAVRFFFVADKVKNGEIVIEYLNTGEMLADILTKPLQGSLFEKLRNQLLNWNG